MNDLIPILLGLLLGVLGMLGLRKLAPREEEAPVLQPPTPTTTPTELTEIDDALPDLPADPTTADLVEWADDARRADEARD